MKKILFSIYTEKHGHNVVSFAPYENGKNAFDNAISYAKETYNDPSDPPQLFLMTEVPMVSVVGKLEVCDEYLKKSTQNDGCGCGCRY